MTIDPHPHPNCLLCGDDNPWSLRLRFDPGPDGGVVARFRGRSELQGYDGILHGGVIASLLDAAMTNCLFQMAVEAVTGDLRIRYRRSVPYYADLELRARVLLVKRPLFVVEADLVCDSRIAASASARFMERKR